MMHQLNRSRPSTRGINRTTALALLASLALFSTIVCFGVANAMLPSSVPAAELLDQEEPTGPVPALESPDGTEAVAVRALAEGEVEEGTAIHDDPPTSTAVQEGTGTSRTTRGQARGTSRTAPPTGRQGGAAGVEGRTDEGSSRRITACDSADPLCGVDFGGPLDA